MKKRALSESEFWESGMNPSLYSVCDSEGTFILEMILVGK